MLTHDDMMEMIVSADDLYNELEEASGHPEYSITIIYVQTQRDFRRCHIKGSINILERDLANELEDWDRAQTIVVYSEGEDSALSRLAYLRLVDMGFVDVRILEGGLAEWVDCGYPTGGECDGGDEDLEEI